MTQNSRLFNKLNAPYYIYAPSYREESGGVRTLHYLCHALNLIGEEAYIVLGKTVPWLRTPSLTDSVKDEHALNERHPILIYPEVVNGNPMDARNVVRYLLNFPGHLTGVQPEWDSNDLIYTHGIDVVPPGMDAALLQTPLINTLIFNNIGIDDSKRSGKLLWISRYLDRGGQLDQLVQDATEISLRAGLRTPQQLASLYRSAEALYTYEPSTACYEALMCGCPVVYLPNDIMLQKPQLNYLTDAGSAWGPEPEKLEEARRTLSKIPAIYAGLENVFWKELSAFVEHTQSHARANAIHVPAASPFLVPPSVQMPQHDNAIPPYGLAQKKKRLLVFSSESPLSPCPQIRVLRPLALFPEEWEVIWGIKDGKLLTDEIKNADFILMHRYTPGLLSIASLQTIFDQGKPVIYETDDLLNEMPEYHPQGGAAWKEGIEFTIRRALAVVVSTPYLAEKYRPLNPAVHVLPNYVDFDAFYRPVPRRQRDVITIGLLGTSIQSPNFDLVDVSLRTLCEKYGSKLKIVFVGWTAPEGWENHPNAEFIPVIVNYADYIDRLRQMQWSIALVPLAADDFNRSKSTIKWLEYSAAGISTVFSDVPIYSDVVTHGETGLLADDSTSAWTEAITSLIEDKDYRYRIASQAQAAVRGNYALKDKVALYGETYARIAATTKSAPAMPAAAAAVSAAQAPASIPQSTKGAKRCMVVYSMDPKNSPCSQIRLWRPFQLLKNNWEFLWAWDEKHRSDLLESADIVILHRTFVARLPRAALDKVLDCGKPVIYESDDLLNEIPAYHRDNAVEQKDAIEYAIRRAHAVVVSSEYLAGKYRSMNPSVHVLPNYIDFNLFYRALPPRKDTITIGLLGTSIQEPNFTLVDHALRSLSKSYGARLQIHLWGFKPPPGWKMHPHMKFIPVNYDYESYAKQLSSLNWDIALVPLAEDPFNLSKSPIKWLEYSAMGIASIFSDIAVYRDVLEHERTGLLVPDSPKAWSEAIALLVEDVDKRRAMAQAAQDTVREKFNLYRNVDEYDRCYRELTDAIKQDLIDNPRAPVELPAAAAEEPAPSGKKHLVVLSIESTWSPCPQIRFVLPFSYLQDEWELVWGIENGAFDYPAIKRADLIVLHRFTPGLIPLSDLRTLYGMGKPIVYETDDLLNEIPEYHPQAADGRKWKAGIEYAVKNSRAVVVSTPFLAEKYRPLNANVNVLPNYIDFDRFYRRVPSADSDPITIGLLGTSIQGPNYALVDAALHSIVDRHPSRIRIYFIGWEAPAGWENHPAVTFLPFIHEYQNYAKQLLEMQWDIALVPLVDDNFNHSKSAIKWLEYGAAGIAPVFSDVSVYRDAVEHGRTGLLVQDAPGEWLGALTSLIENPALRRQIARTAQAQVRKHYSLSGKSALYDQVYGSVTGAGHPDTAAVGQPLPEPAVRGMLLLDPEGDAAKVDLSLRSLNGAEQEKLVVIVLTVQEGDVPEWSDTLRYVQAGAAEYAAAVEQLSAHPDFDWVAIMEAGAALEGGNPACRGPGPGGTAL